LAVSMAPSIGCQGVGLVVIFTYKVWSFSGSCALGERLFFQTQSIKIYSMKVHLDTMCP